MTNCFYLLAFLVMNSRSEIFVLWQPFNYGGNNFFDWCNVFSYWVAMFSFEETFFYYGQPFANPFGAGLGGVGATLVFLGSLLATRLRKFIATYLTRKLKCCNTELGLDWSQSPYSNPCWYLDLCWFHHFDFHYMPTHKIFWTYPST